MIVSLTCFLDENFFRLVLFATFSPSHFLVILLFRSIQSDDVIGLIAIDLSALKYHSLYLLINQHVRFFGFPAWFIRLIKVMNMISSLRFTN